METEIKLEHGRDNIFDISGAETWTCQVSGFRDTFSIMWIRAWDRDHKQERNLVFRLAYFFDGPTQWVGANFHVAPQDECIALLETFGWLNNIPKDQLQSYLEHFYLVVVPSIRYKVSVLTQSAYLAQEIPADFKVIN